MIDAEDETTEDKVARIATSAAHGGRLRHGRYVSFNEALSATTIWLLEHPRKTEELLEDGERGERRLTNLAARAVEVVARGNRAQVVGYDPEDEYFYNRGMVETILPAVFDPNYKPWVDRDEDGPRGTLDPSEAGNWEAMVADVTRAWNHASLTDDQEEALRLRFGDSKMLVDVANHLNIRRETAGARIKAGLDSMVRYLGGFNPACHRGCECGGGPVGRRKVMSNAAWRAQSDNYYNE